MKEENNNFETNVNVNPQPVDLNPVQEDNTALEMPQVSTPEPAPIEMPSPVDAAPLGTEAPVEAPVTPEVTPVSAPVEMPAPAPVEAPVESAQVEAAPVDAPAPVEAPVEAPVQGSAPIEAPNIDSASMSTLAPVVEAPESVAAPDMTSAEDIAKGIQDGSFVNAVSDPNEMIGAKVGSSSDTESEDKKKKGKKKVVGLIVVLVLLLVLGGLGYFGYTYEFKSADKRVDALFDKINSYTIPLLKDVEKRIGDYDIDASVTMNTDKIQLHMNGNYAYNLEDYIYFDTSIDRIYYNQDLIDKTPIKLNVYLNDDKLYFKSEELFSKYISIDVDGLSEFMNNIKQNDVNYTALYSSVMNAFKSSIEKYTLSQSIEDVTIDGKKTKANVVTININKGNSKAIMTNMLSILANSDPFLTNVASISGLSKEEIKEALSEAKNDDYTMEGTFTAKLYTKVIGNELLGIDILTSDEDSKYAVSIIPQGTDSYKVVSKKDNTQLSNFVYTMSKTQSSGKIAYVSSIKGDLNVDDSVYQLDIKSTYNINLQYQEDKPVVRDKVSLENLTQEDYLTIANNAQEKYGIIGTYISSLFSLVNGYSTAGSISSKCLEAISCDCQTGNEYCACKYYDENDSLSDVVCPNR